MPETAEVRDVATKKKPLRFRKWGGTPADQPVLNPHVLTRSLLAQQILMQISKEPKSIIQLAQEVGAGPVYVSDHLESLIACELVTEVDDGRYLADFFILQRADQQAISDRNRQVGRTDAEVIVEHLDEIQEAVRQCRFEVQGSCWDEIRWIVLPNLVANLGVRRAHAEVYAIEPPLRPAGASWYFFGETQDEPRQRWVTGCNTSCDESGGVAQFWTPTIDMPRGWLPNRQGRQVLLRLADGSMDLSTIATEVEADDVEEIAAHLIESDWAQKENGQLRTVVPIFTQADDEILSPVVDRICNEIVDRSRRPGLDGTDEVLDQMGYGHLHTQYPAMHAVVSSDISGRCLEALVEQGVLGQPPAKPSPTFGCWAWTGKINLMRF